jgi:O-acetylhomoserine (thiol)-lyase
MTLLESGDEIVSAAGVFGGTLDLFRDLQHFGIKTILLEAFTPESLTKATGPRTKVIFAETIGNPKLNIPDFGLLHRFAAERDIPLVLDNTAATPYLFRPKDYGAAVVIHSTSKYISGSGNTIGGVIIDTGQYKWNAARHPVLKRTEKFGDFMFLSALRQGLFRNIGACMTPFGVYLTALGLETLGIRMERACANAMALAGYLAEHPTGKPGHAQIAVNYPGLPDNPGRAAAQQYFGGRYGALLTLRTGSKESAFRLINGLKLAKNAANIGDVRTLVIHPASTIFVHADENQKHAAGVYDDLIRISVGIEDAEDLIADFQQAINQK